MAEDGRNATLPLSQLHAVRFYNLKGCPERLQDDPNKDTGQCTLNLLSSDSGTAYRPLLPASKHSAFPKVSPEETSVWLRDASRLAG